MTMPQAGDLFSTLVANCVINTFLSYTAIMLNIITIHALRKTSSLPKPFKTLLLSLAVSDLGVGLLVQPLHIAGLVIKMEQNKNDSDLKFLKACRIIMFFLIFASFLSVVALTIDRFLAIHLHLRYQELVTHKCVVAVMISIWVFSALLSLFNLNILNWISVKNSFIIFATVDGVCYLTTGFIYCKIYAAVRRHTNEIQALQAQQVVTPNGEMTNAARIRKTAVDIFYVYLVFLTCFLPFSCITVASLISGESLQTWKMYSETQMFLNSSLNPLIYCWKMRQFRHSVMDILRNIYLLECFKLFSNL